MADLGTPTSFKTIWVLGALSLLLVGWDVYASFSPSEATISAVVLWVSRHPIFPFLAGVIAGHLFWPQIQKPQEKDNV